MSFIKNVSGPYTINTINHDDPITLDSNNVIINGSLFVNGSNTFLGNVTSAEVQQTYIVDNVITLNANASVLTTPYPGPSGIEVERGSVEYNAILRWYEPSKTWQIRSNVDGAVYYNLVATSTGNTRVVDDVAPQLGGNLFTNGYAITNVTGNIFLDPATTVSLNGNLSLQIAGNIWSNAQAYNTLISNQVGAGGTGLYVTTGDGGITNQELITKRRAIVYSIVF
jgi:hypothetical protein